MPGILRAILEIDWIDMCRFRLGDQATMMAWDFVTGHALEDDFVSHHITEDDDEEYGQMPHM